MNTRPSVKCGILLGAILLCACRCNDQPVPGPPTIHEDPIVSVNVPGAYGVPGGNQVYIEDRSQLSLLEGADGCLSFRILDEGERKVLSISGIPSDIREGDYISLYYRLMINGYSIEENEYENVRAVKVSESGIWLKKDENCYFVIAR